MRYYLLFRKGEYFILPAQISGILMTAIAQGAPCIASVESSSEIFATRHLFTVALLHHIATLKELKRKTKDKHT